MDSAKATSMNGVKYIILLSYTIRLSCIDSMTTHTMITEVILDILKL